MVVIAAYTIAATALNSRIPRLEKVRALCHYKAFACISAAAFPVYAAEATVYGVGAEGNVER